MYRSKRILVFLLCFVIFFNTFSCKKAKAVTGIEEAVVLGGLGSEAITGGTVAAAASSLAIPAVVAGGALAVGVLGGAVFYNREAIYSYLKNFVDNGLDSIIQTANDKIWVDSDDFSKVKDLLADGTLTNIPDSYGIVFDGFVSYDNPLFISRPSSIPCYLKVNAKGNTLAFGFSSAGTKKFLKNKFLGIKKGYSYIMYGAIQDFIFANNTYILKDNGTYGPISQNIYNNNCPYSVTDDDVLCIRPLYDTIKGSDITIESTCPSAKADDISYSPSSYDVPKGTSIALPNAIPLDGYVGQDAYTSVEKVATVEGTPEEGVKDEGDGGILSFLKDILNKILAALSSLNFIEAIKNISSSILETLANIWDWCGTIAESIGSAVGSFVGAVLSGIEEGVKSIGNTLANIWDWCGTVADSIGAVISATVVGTLEGIKDFCSTIANTVISIKDWCGSVASSITSPIIDFFTVPSAETFVLSDLKTIFPFCIPFDVIDIIKLFLVDPEPIVFSYDLDYVFGSHKFNFDFSEWHPISTICRTFFSLIFIVSLAFVTKKLIKW